MITKLLKDIVGIYKVVGFYLLMKWTFYLFINVFKILQQKNLEPADKAMGNGPIKVRFNNKTALLSGLQVFSGIREIWVRDCYLSTYLNFNDDKLVVDLGANIGVFTQLALSQNSELEIISVEPNYRLLRDLENSVKNNGWNDRVRTIRSFLGTKTDIQKQAINNESYRDVKFISEDEFIKRFSIQKIDFLKIDIEGSEFSFINQNSKLLLISKKIAIEIHENGGDVQAFINYLQFNNFTVHSIKWARGGCVLLATRNI